MPQATESAPTPPASHRLPAFPRQEATKGIRRSFMIDGTGTCAAAEAETPATDSYRRCG